MWRRKIFVPLLLYRALKYTAVINKGCLFRISLNYCVKFDYMYIFVPGNMKNRIDGEII